MILIVTKKTKLLDKIDCKLNNPKPHYLVTYAYTASLEKDWLEMERKLFKTYFTQTTRLGTPVRSYSI